MDWILNKFNVLSIIHINIAFLLGNILSNRISDFKLSRNLSKRSVW